MHIDSKSLRILNRWSKALGESPSGMAIDAVHSRLFIGSQPRTHRVHLVTAQLGPQSRTGCINSQRQPRKISQGLKPSVFAAFTARLKPCPFKARFMQPVLGTREQRLGWVLWLTRLYHAAAWRRL